MLLNLTLYAKQKDVSCNLIGYFKQAFESLFGWEKDAI